MKVHLLEFNKFLGIYTARDFIPSDIKSEVRGVYKKTILEIERYNAREILVDFAIFRALANSLSGRILKF